MKLTEWTSFPPVRKIELELWDPAEILSGAECLFLSIVLNVVLLADWMELSSTSESLILLRNTLSQSCSGFIHANPPAGLRQGSRYKA
jgi:hypothetical protein